MLAKRLLFFSAGAVLAATGLAHGSHESAGQKPVVDDSADWATKHMAEEHHIAGFDPASFFTLHDFDNDGIWSPNEIERTYGLYDPSNAEILQKRRGQIVDSVLALFDGNRDGRVSRDEWRSAHAAGVVLPDLGTGPGHHGDDEYEYEIHHWEKYHDDNTKLEDLTHPEDIAHFKHHEELEAEEARLEALSRLTIVFDNVPSLFRRQ
ncbi:secretory pathway protein [Grosmannia clavigera kw1407]|uniref:Secretory pathway protein n=1 Tax=Grosmannia clavigera (strain kw1407 / UAMH 11150) TaxID=655863 RepID=F0X6S7_GROCL|nr:secretory pathway protein [Grosmannia clavigera kw1407]EFX06484.1 secretory pathway protein [Grosmannia clavigera kw1407]